MKSGRNSGLYGTLKTYFAYKDVDGNDKLIHAILFGCVITNMFQSF